MSLAQNTAEMTNEDETLFRTCFGSETWGKFGGTFSVTFFGAFAVKGAEKVFRDVARDAFRKVFPEAFGGHFNSILIGKHIRSKLLKIYSERQLFFGGGITYQLRRHCTIISRNFDFMFWGNWFFIHRRGAVTPYRKTIHQTCARQFITHVRTYVHQ